MMVIILNYIICQCAHHTPRANSQILACFEWCASSSEKPLEPEGVKIHYQHSPFVSHLTKGRAFRFVVQGSATTTIKPLLICLRHSPKFTPDSSASAFPPPFSFAWLCREIIQMIQNTPERMQSNNLILRLKKLIGIQIICDFYSKNLDTKFNFALFQKFQMERIAPNSWHPNLVKAHGHKRDVVPKRIN